MLTPGAAIAQAPTASSNFIGFEDPLSEDGAWVALTTMAAQGTQFQKNFGAYPDSTKGDHAGARTTAAIPADHYSEIVVGHVANTDSYVGPFVRVQTQSEPSDRRWYRDLQLQSRQSRPDRLRAHLLGLLRLRHGGDPHGYAGLPFHLRQLERLRYGLGHDLHRDRECGEIGHRQLLALAGQDWRYGQPLSDAGPAGQALLHPGDASQGRRQRSTEVPRMDRTARDRDLAIATYVEDRRCGLSAPGHPIIEPDVADLRHLVDLNHQPLP